MSEEEGFLPVSEFNKFDLKYFGHKTTEKMFKNKLKKPLYIFMSFL